MGIGSPPSTETFVRALPSVYASQRPFGENVRLRPAAAVTSRAAASFTRRTYMRNPFTPDDVNAIMSPFGDTAIVVPVITSLMRVLGGRSKLARTTGVSACA